MVMAQEKEQILEKETKKEIVLTSQQDQACSYRRGQTGILLGPSLLLET